jgi:hypothetical protein
LGNLPQRAGGSYCVPQVHWEFVLNYQVRDSLSDHPQCTSLTLKNRPVPLRVARVWHDIPTRPSRWSRVRRGPCLSAGDLPVVWGGRLAQTWAMRALCGVRRRASHEMALRLAKRLVDWHGSHMKTGRTILHREFGGCVGF